MPLRVLIIDDSVSDADLILRYLKKADYTITSQRVENVDSLEEALKKQSWDIVISDYDLLQFDVSTALALLLKTELDIPFIVVIDNIDEKRAASLMRLGAQDYVLKDELAHLAPAVKRELNVVRLRREKRESNERFRQLADNASDIVFRVNFTPTLKLVYINPAVLAITGYTPQEWYTDRDLIFHIVHPDDNWQIANLMQTLKPPDEPIVMRWVSKDGKTHWVEIRLTAVRDMTGNLVAVEGITRDISKSKVEEAMRQFELGIERSTDAIFMTLPNGMITYINPAFEQLYGYSQAEALGKTPRILKSGVLPQETYEQFWASLLANQAISGELVNRAKDGRLIVLDSSVNPIQDEEGHFSGFLAIQRDISGRKQGETFLRESEERYRTLFENNPLPMWVYDRETLAFLSVNDAAVNHYGYSVKEFLHMTILDIHTPEQISSLKMTIKDFTGILRKVGEWRQRKKDGSIIDVEITTHELIFEGRPARLVLAHDITERKQAEELIRQSAARAEALARVVNRINSNLDLASVLAAVCEEVSNMFHLPAAVLLFNDQQDDLHVEAAFGFPTEFFQRRNTIPRALYDALVQKFGPVVVLTDINVLQELPDPKLYTDFDIRMIAGTGIVYNGNLIGALIVNSFHTPRGLSEDEQFLLQTFASQAAVGIQNARLYKLANSRTRELEFLAGVSSALREAENRLEMLPILVKKAHEISRADNVTLVFIEDNTIEIVAGYGESENHIGERYPSVIAPFRDVLQTDQSMFVDNFKDYAGKLKWNTSVNPLGWLADEVSCALIPLNSSHALIGLFHLGYLSPHIFYNEEQRLLIALSEMASNALERAGVIETLERRVEDRTCELETLYRVASISSSSLNLKQILEQSLRIILQSICANSGSIHLLGNERDPEDIRNNYAPDHSVLHLVAEFGLAEGLISKIRSMPLGFSLTGRVAQQNEVLVIFDIASDPRAAFPQYFTGVPVSYIGLPIRWSGEVVGVMNIFNLATKQIKPENIALLTTISDHLGIVIKNAGLQRNAEKVAVIAERQRLARELHDSITQVLYSLGLFAGAGKNQALTADREKLKQHFQKIETSTQQALKEMRLLIYELRPSVLEEEGLVAALQHRLEAVEGRVGILSKIIVEGNMDLPVNLEVELYRIALEALNNILKHARASSVILQIGSGKEMFMMEIIDDGQGFDPDGVRDHGGMGLKSLRERAEKIGGILTITSSLMNGTRVKVVVKR
jgi:PAS domain S-box-containing protein